MDYFNDLNPYLVRQDPAPAETPDTGQYIHSEIIVGI